jgi:hypothetical protein
MQKAIEQAVLIEQYQKGVLKELFISIRDEVDAIKEVLSDGSIRLIEDLLRVERVLVKFRAEQERILENTAVGIVTAFLDVSTKPNVYVEILEHELIAHRTTIGILVSNYFENKSNTYKSLIKRAFISGMSSEVIEAELDNIAKNYYSYGTSINRTIAYAALNKSRHIINKKRAFKYVTFKSMLDSRSTKLCSKLDGKLYGIDIGPKPPLHINCRSLRIGTNNKTIDIYESYNDWLKVQPLGKQTSILGVGKTTKFNSGEVLFDKLYAKGRQMSIKELTTKLNLIN